MSLELLKLMWKHTDTVGDWEVIIIFFHCCTELLTTIVSTITFSGIGDWEDFFLATLGSSSSGTTTWILKSTDPSSYNEH